MSLDVHLTAVRSTTVYTSNITHNLAPMARAAGIYNVLWRPGITTASQLIPDIEKGLSAMKARPEFYRQFNAPNEWGTYEQFIPWIEEYLAACKANPDATVDVSV